SLSFCAAAWTSAAEDVAPGLRPLKLSSSVSEYADAPVKRMLFGRTIDCALSGDGDERRQRERRAREPIVVRIGREDSRSRRSGKAKTRSTDEGLSSRGNGVL